MRICPSLSAGHGLCGLRKILISVNPQAGGAASLGGKFSLEPHLTVHTDLSPCRRIFFFYVIRGGIIPDISALSHHLNKNDV